MSRLLFHQSEHGEALFKEPADTFLRLTTLTLVRYGFVLLNVPKLLLGHPKIVPQFMYESLANLMAHFGLA